MRFTMIVTEEAIPPCKILYMRRTGAYGTKNCKLMSTFKKWLADNRLYDAHTVIYAIPLDNPETTPPCQCRYDVCIPYPTNRSFEWDQVKCKEWNPGNYVVFQIPHTPDAIQAAWKTCFSALAEQGYLLDTSRPVMERYQKNLVDKHCCELCLPVLERAAPL